jgi:hypothetical protein
MFLTTRKRRIEAGHTLERDHLDRFLEVDKYNTANTGYNSDDAAIEHPPAGKSEFKIFREPLQGPLTQCEEIVLRHNSLM